MTDQDLNQDQLLVRYLGTQSLCVRNSGNYKTSSCGSKDHSGDTLSGFDDRLFSNIDGAKIYYTRADYNYHDIVKSRNFRCSNNTLYCGSSN